MLAKGSGLYFETYLAFQRALGRPVTPFDLSGQKPKLPGGLKAVVSFGAKAAAYKYPKDVKIIFTLSPGYLPDDLKDFIRISPLPDPQEAVTIYKKLQPALKRLAFIYSPPAFEPYISKLRQPAKAAGIEIIPVPLSSASELPETLRSLLGSVDAIWLMPDPKLINRTLLAVLAEFSCSHKVPFYAPSGGLISFGAAAAFAPGHKETGEAAAQALTAVLAGKELPGIIFPENPVLTLNRGIITKCGLPLILPGEGGAK